MDEEQLARRRESDRKYRTSHPARVAATQQKYRETHPRKEYLRAYAASHRGEIAAYSKQYAKTHRRRYRLQSYGMTEAEYDAMVETQCGQCAVCGRVPPYELVVDHDHTTGRIRGLLCQGCNAAIGYLGDTRDGVARALDYLSGCAPTSTTSSCVLHNDGHGRGTKELRRLAGG